VQERARVLDRFNREEILHAIVVKFTNHLNCVRTLLRKLKQQHFSVKTLLFFVHLRSQQKRTEKVISSNQIYSAAILTLLF